MRRGKSSPFSLHSQGKNRSYKSARLSSHSYKGVSQFCWTELTVIISVLLISVRDYHLRQNTILPTAWHVSISSSLTGCTRIFLITPWPSLPPPPLPPVYGNVSPWVDNLLVDPINHKHHQENRQEKWAAWRTITCEILTRLLSELSDKKYSTTNGQIPYNRD